jgi:hypothetical protein
MSKAKVTTLFVGGFVTMVGGVIIALATALPAVVGGGVFAIGGPDIVTVNGAAFAGTLAWLSVAWLVIAAGTLAALASWVAALVNTAQLEDRTWFFALLVLGLCSFGWLAMIAYVIAGPDGTRQHDARSVAAAAL